MKKEGGRRRRRRRRRRRKRSGKKEEEVFHRDVNWNKVQWETVCAATGTKALICR